MRHTKVWFDDHGDLILIDGDLSRYPYLLTEQYAKVRQVRRFWTHDAASRAINTALLDAEAFVYSIREGRAESVTRPLL